MGRFECFSILAEFFSHPQKIVVAVVFPMIWLEVAQPVWIPETYIERLFCEVVPTHSINVSGVAHSRDPHW